MKKLFLIIPILLMSCSENYSNGERIGLVTQFSKSGIFWKSWEGHLNITQTGMNSSVPFDFSIDNDNEDPELVKKIDSAANYGWKVKLVYHETFGKNWFQNRGETSHFIKECVILDRTPMDIFQQHSQNDSILTSTSYPMRQGKIIDTIYVIIYKDKP